VIDLDEIRQLAREFAAREIRPHAAEWENSGAIPRSVIDQLAELGFLGMLIPEEWDGLEVGMPGYLAALEEIAWGDASVAVAMSVHNSLPTQMILRHGTADQKERWLRPMARGELLGAFALSEADAGSDPAALSARATRGDGGWILNVVDHEWRLCRHRDLHVPDGAPRRPGGEGDWCVPGADLE
jgi:alkylation response protein AidB-like acyl-CoA dehydrogenase